MFLTKPPSGKKTAPGPSLQHQLAYRRPAATRTVAVGYLRRVGKFAGVSLEGSTLRPDNGANKNLYGKDVSAQDIVF
jgi:lipid-binding SYLF domain-containing protein